MTELVVGGAFLCIGEHRVGFGQFLEFVFGLLVTGIFIGMILNGQATIRLFNFGIARVTVDFEYFVIITFRQNIKSCGIPAAGQPEWQKIQRLTGSEKT